jgi:2-methylisocitrate lyase-like PEP mutase family enzyme
MTDSNSSIFRTLHHANEPLLLNNVWDAASAAIVQSNGAKAIAITIAIAIAIATSSVSMAWSLGYVDGSQLPTNELLDAIKRMQRVISLPLTVDNKNGYSDNKNLIAELAYQLVEAGVVSINIEDGTSSTLLLAEKIHSIKAKVGDSLFINARTDVYLQNLVADEVKLSTVMHRLKLYAEAGANSGFIPGLSDTIDVQTLLIKLTMPINLMINGNQKEIELFSGMG